MHLLKVIGLSAALAALVAVSESPAFAQTTAATVPAAPEVGQMAPDFTLPWADSSGTRGAPVKLSDLRGKVVVIAFYPQDRTQGCTIEMTRFRDEYKTLFGENVVVLPISGDSLASHHSWAKDMKFPFALVSDVGLKTAELYGSKRVAVLAPRATPSSLEKMVALCIELFPSMPRLRAVTCELAAEVAKARQQLTPFSKKSGPHWPASFLLKRSLLLFVIAVVRSHAVRHSVVRRSVVRSSAVLDRRSVRVTPYSPPSTPSTAVLRITEQHPCVLMEEQRIVHASVSRRHAALVHDDGLCFPHLQHRHAGNWTVWISFRRRIHDVICTDDKHRICLRKIFVDLIHFENDVIGNLRFSQKHVHVPRHAARNRMNCETHLNPLARSFCVIS